MIPELWRRLAYYLRRHRFEEELDEEIRHHLVMSGRWRFGNVTHWKEQSRAVWNWTLLEQLAQDLRHALRAIIHNRIFTALAVLSLALGIGANTAIFSFMDAILLRSLPVNDPASLVMLNWRSKAFYGGIFRPREDASSVVQRVMGRIDDDPRGGVISGIFPYPAFELLQKSSSVFSSVFGYRPVPPLNVKIGGQADLADGEYVSGAYFGGLGVLPAAGRLLMQDDDRAGAPPVAVLSFAYSQKGYGDPARAVGSAISINKVSFTVVGVTPPEFFGVDPGEAPGVFLPLHADFLLSSGNQTLGLLDADALLDSHYYWLQIMARLRRGVSVRQAEAAVAPVFHGWVSDTAANEKERANLPALVVLPGGGGVDSLRRQYFKPLSLLLALVALILAIACANLGNLLLARVTARRREMAVRLSMGAGRLRVIRQLLTESVLLAAFGGLLGTAFAFWGIRFLTLLLANGRGNFTLRAQLNWQVLAVAAGLSLLTGILFGLAPAIQSTRVDVTTGLKNDVRHSAPAAAGRFLIAGQIAIALLFLVGAGLFVGTLANLHAIQVGFNRENLLLFQIDARQAGHRDPELADFYRNLQAQFQAIPGVRNATLSNLSMMAGGMMAFPLKVHGKRITPTLVLDVGPSFLRTMQIPRLAGHDIEDRGRAVAVVDEEFAKTYFPGENPVGQHIAAPGPAPHDDDLEIVGVSAKAKYGDIRGHQGPMAYILYDHVTFPPLSQMTFELRTTGNPLNYVPAIREIVRKADPGVPVSDIKTQAAEIEERTNQETIVARLSTLFAILALAITCVGLYGTVCYNIARRTNEIGIRIALGAHPTRVVRMILRDVLATVLAGLAIGIPAALLSSKLVSSFLYGTKPNDPQALMAAVTILSGAALLAGYAPARRASRVDPMNALRDE